MSESSKMKRLSFIVVVVGPLILCLRLANLCSGGDDQLFVYSGFAGTNLSMDGVAAITADGMVELTNGTLQRKGHAFYPEPVRLRDSTSFVFGILSDHVELSAHGMAFVVAGSRDFSAALPSGYLGLLNVQSNGNSSNRLFAVELDTMQNDEFRDIEMNARLGDFGLARLYDHGGANNDADDDSKTTHVVGTIGYIAPELGRTGKASTLTDIFAFGIFLLEVACGRRPIIKQPAQDSDALLADWVLHHWHNGSLTEAVDARLQGNYDIDEASMVLKLGLLCSHPFLNARPSMRQVTQYLDGDMALPEFMPTYHISSMTIPEQTHTTRPKLKATSNGSISSLSGGR